tara:strand:- start:64 stop:309 length:246 start_codon:yes stop_codon:yes gene_type:complete
MAMSMLEPQSLSVFGRVSSVLLLYQLARSMLDLALPSHFAAMIGFPLLCAAGTVSMRISINGAGLENEIQQPLAVQECRFG